MTTMHAMAAKPATSIHVRLEKNRSPLVPAQPAMANLAIVTFLASVSNRLVVMLILVLSMAAPVVQMVAQRNVTMVTPQMLMDVASSVKSKKVGAVRKSSLYARPFVETV